MIDDDLRALGNVGNEIARHGGGLIDAFAAGADGVTEIRHVRVEADALGSRRLLDLRVVNDDVVAGDRLLALDHLDVEILVEDLVGPRAHLGAVAGLDAVHDGEHEAKAVCRRGIGRESGEQRHAVGRAGAAGAAARGAATGGNATRCENRDEQTKTAHGSPFPLG
jgi:hypothetical protein